MKFAVLIQGVPKNVSIKDFNSDLFITFNL